MSVSERRQWLETPAGRLHAALGISDETDYDAADAKVEAVRKHLQRTYGRELSEREVQRVRAEAELRSAAGTVADVPVSVPQLVERVNSATVNAGWSYVPEFRGQSSGIATLQDGQWSGDPVVVGRVQAAEADRAERDAAAGAAWANGPAVMRTVAGPS